MSKNKTVANDASVDEFLSGVKDPIKREDCFTLNALMQKVTQHSPQMWGGSIVGYDSYHYVYDSGRAGDFMKVGFSPRAQNLTIYIMPGFERYPELMTSLGKHKVGKSCLYVKKLADIDMEVLEALVTESYNYMTNKYG
ncbi:DUF1801 domain-containing protein [Roseivirga misakiensis]|uniref:YdhG-like domain-containing protein n=1 Tax=Roseivirga misakiensis TaxID=1563681 RepID=A0A1E5T148_9BACT|nr:DUF1801 domain-containing protein [Roseivirga misakiensis]OEK05089.1 hypothetical protein BFP71_16865 [Roseivirga misakiensis]